MGLFGISKLELVIPVTKVAYEIPPLPSVNESWFPKPAIKRNCSSVSSGVKFTIFDWNWELLSILPQLVATIGSVKLSVVPISTIEGSIFKIDPIGINNSWLSCVKTVGILLLAS